MSTTIFYSINDFVELRHFFCLRLYFAYKNFVQRKYIKTAVFEEDYS